MSILSPVISAYLQKLKCGSSNFYFYFLQKWVFFYYTSNTWHASPLQNRCVFLLIKQNKDVMLVIILETMASRDGAAPDRDASSTW